MLKYFKRKTNNSAFIPEIDGMRFFAIITVVLFHINTSFSGATNSNLRLLIGFDNFYEAGWWLVRLDLGVKVFFAISGFILAIPFLKHYLANGKKITLSDYFYRRLTRLEPPFLISLLVFYFTHIIILNEHALSILPNLIASLFYIHSFVFGFPSIINPVTWSLETEAQFYIVIPFLTSFLFLFKKRWLSFVFIFLLIAFSIFLKYEIDIKGLSNLSYSIFSYFSNFLSGLLFAWLYLKKKIWVEKKNIIWDFIGLISLFLLFYFYKPQADWFNNSVFNASVFLMFLSVFKGNITNWFYTRPIIYIIGGMCYSIYLLHYAFLEMITKIFSPIQLGYSYMIDLGLHFVIYTPLLLFICSLFFIMIEKPCMDKHWPKQLRLWMKLNFFKNRNLF